MNGVRVEFNKVIGIGLPKTGTVSLHHALNVNGIPTVHFGSTVCDEARRKMYRGIYTFDLLDKYRGITNAFEFIFPQIDKAYPNSKFINTVRDKDAWMNSARKHWLKLENNNEVDELSIHHHLITFGTYRYNEDRFSYVYDLHKLVVEDYFKDRRDDLLVIDVTKDSKYVYKVCDFLGIPVKKGKPFHLNKS